MGNAGVLIHEHHFCADDGIEQNEDAGLNRQCDGRFGSMCRVFSVSARHHHNQRIERKNGSIKVHSRRIYHFVHLYPTYGHLAENTSWTVL